MKWWGWGDPAAPAELPARGARLPARRAGRPSAARPPVAARGGARRRPRFREKRAGALTRRRRRGVGARRPRQSRIVHAAGKGYPDLVRMRAGDAESAPDAVVYPGRRGRGAARARGLRVRARSPSCRSAAAPASWAASSRCATAWRRSISLDLARMAAVSDVDERSLTADPRARACAGPQVEQRARRARASRSGTSRSRSSTRPSAAGSRRAPPARPRPATARSRSWSPACAA